ncbi:MAG: hypothetical protein J7513_07175 [Solirubrobacteraceae bacterium]|nr:hypothetical protein [Solirubrobacteraceae bacterium]
MPRSGSPRRRVVGAIAVALSAALLSGCVKIKSLETTQRDGVGDVRVTLDLCQSTSFTSGAIEPFDEDGCAIHEIGAAGLPVQVFVTYVVPDGVGLPQELSVVGGTAGDALVADDDDTDALLSGATAPAGYRFATYRSPVTPALANGAGVARADSVVADFDVSALTGDFTYAATVSWRFASTDPLDTAFDPARAVLCGSTGGPGSSSAVPLPGASCRTATEPAAPGAGTITAGSWTLFTVPTNRLELHAPTDATLGAGGTDTVEFPATSHLASAPVQVPLQATTTIPGATASAPGHLALGGSADVPVEVTVPPGTPTGTYLVTLTAGSGSGIRTAQTAAIVVEGDPGPPAATATPAITATPVATVAPTTTAGSATSSVPAPTTPPADPQRAVEASASDVVTIVQGKKKTGQLRKGAATVPVSVSGPGTVRLTIHGRSSRGKKFPVWAVGETYARAAGSVDVTIKPTKLGRALLKGDEPVKATLVVRFFGAGSKYVAPGQPITLG